ncbi:hypothetical protein JCM19992_21190 [Thermostilla marina]
MLKTTSHPIAFLAVSLSSVVYLGCGERAQELSPGPSDSAGKIVLRDVTTESGIDFVHTDGSSGRRYIVETVSAGVAVFDYDNDGLLDIYFLNGAPLPGYEGDDTLRNRLYRNLGGFRFEDVTAQAGVGDTQFGLGVAVADYDNDGDLDLFLNNYGHNVLYRNNGDGTFTDITSEAGVAGEETVGAGANFVDVDNDGLLDLYAANYVDFTFENHKVHRIKGFELYSGPRDYRPVPDYLYRNNGDGTFSDISKESGIAQLAGTGMGSICSDIDNDGDQDIFVVNDVAGNFLYQNDGTGHFDEIALFAGLAYNGQGDETGSMGVDCGDYDNDGLPDFCMTAYQGEMPVLYHNNGDGTFEDRTLIANAGDGCFPYVNWGVGFVDLDNDGDRDLFIANGHLMDNIDLFDHSTAYKVRNVVLENDGTGRFRNISDTCGDGLAPVESSRGAAFGDLDNDGDIDIVVLNSRSKPTIIRNDQSTKNHWLQIRLRGVRSNRDGVGAVIRVTASGKTHVDDVHSGRGYQSHWGLWVHFGLGNAARVERLEVRWPSGTVDVLSNIEVDRRLVVTEGSHPVAGDQR